MLKRLALYILLFTVGLLLFIATVLVVFPAGIIADFVVESVEAETGVSIRYDSFERVFPFGIEAKGIEIKDRAEGLDFTVDRLRLSLKPARLFGGRLALLLDADLLGGSIDGIMVFGSSGMSSDLRVRSLRPELFALSKEYAVQIPFALSGAVNIESSYAECAEGLVVIESDSGANSGTLSALGFGLDFGAGAAAGLRATLKECRAEVKGLWVEGPDLVTRLSGEVLLDSRHPEQSRLDLFAELNDLTLKGSNRLLLSFLKRYELRQGYYAMEITGTVGRPRIQRQQ
ncbi:MAG: type II secretion system protein GspN [Proteobacteria bacterium]|nr:type II secretion system protein GspN [Pseudomonadota bacterium]